MKYLPYVNNRSLTRTSRELAHLVGAKIWPTSVGSRFDQEEYLLKPIQAPNDYEKLGFYCNSRLYEMALDGHATLADKICLANDLKDRRDHDYAKALLTHILPGIPIWEKSAILHSDGLKDWLQSDPRGKWCSQNDKAFMYMVVRTFVMNIPSSMQKLDHTRLEDQFKGVDRVDHVISSWRGSNPEDLDALLTECIASQHNGPRSAIQPLDNSISPPECRMGGVGSPKQSGIVPVRVGDCLSLEAEPQQRKANDVGQTMSKLEAQQLSLALRDMHMDTIHRGQNRGRDAVMQRMRHMIDMQNQFVAKERHDYSSSALLCACRKEGPKGPAKPAIVLPSRNPPPTKKQPHGVFKHRRFDSRWGAHHVLNVHRMFMQNET